MFTVLPETRAPRTQRVGSTITSLVMHGVLAAGLVALTTAGPVEATGTRTPHHPIVFVPAHRPPADAPRGPSRATTPVPAPRIPTYSVGTIAPPSIPAVDAGVAPALPEDVLPGSGGRAIPSPGGGGGIGPGVGPVGTGGVIGEHEADRAPRMLAAAPALRYPDVLRGAGITGRVVLQFVVDTLGRAEPGSERVLDATRPEFADAVRRALPQFRFAPGEAGGRRVRTRVQMPFEFRLGEDGR